MPEYYIGTSGWHYNHWKGLFYPERLPKNKWLEYYAAQFNTVEINNSFYRLPTENAFRQWYNGTFPGFKYAVKASRAITHIKRLKDAGEYLDNLLANAGLLREKLAVLLFQLPPQMKVNMERLGAFLAALPPGLRSVFEFRHNSWADEPVFSLLSRYNAGYCIYNMPGYTSPLVATSDFAYIRFHGSEGLYSSSYSDAELEEWARKIRKLPAKLKEVYIYFNNDAGAAAISNARTLRKFLIN